MKQLRLVGAEPEQVRYEVHEHTDLNSRFSPSPVLRHSHEGGDRPHQHEGYGPATYTIDKNDWTRMTGGARGGSRKQFTKKPIGQQLPIAELEDWQKRFEVVYLDQPEGYEGTGGADLAASRMVLSFKLKPTVIDGRRRRAWSIYQQMAHYLRQRAEAYLALGWNDLAAMLETEAAQLIRCEQSSTEAK